MVISAHARFSPLSSVPVPDDLSSNVNDVALVFEGGGMRASFSAGVAATLLEAQIHIGWVGGISAGSSCLANYLSRDVERTRTTFVEFAAHPRFGNWGTWLRGRGLFNAEWIYEHTSEPHQALPFDHETFMRNPASLRIGGFRCKDGQMIYWGRDDVQGRQDLMKRVRASSTMPLLMPITRIDGVDYCDGALGPTGGLAIDAAKADGHDRFLVVLTRERGYRKAPARFPAAHHAVFRRYPAIAHGILERPDNYNRAMAELRHLEKAGRAFLVFPDEMRITNSERNVWRLRSMYEQGRAVASRLLPAIRDFLGLS